MRRSRVASALTYTRCGYIIDGMDTRRRRSRASTSAPDRRRMRRERVDLALEGMTCAACAARIEKTLNRLPGVDGGGQFRDRVGARRLRPRARRRRRAARRRRAGRLRARTSGATSRPSARDEARAARRAWRALRRELVDRRRPDGAASSRRWSPMLRPGARARRAAAALAAARARDAGAVLDRPALLRRRMARAARRRREHGRAGRARHVDRVAVERGRHRARARTSTSTSRRRAAVITLVLLGKALEARAQGRHVGGDRRAAAAAAAASRTSSATDATIDVPLADVVVGDRFVVRAGEAIPVDGSVVEGASRGRRERC